MINVQKNVGVRYHLQVIKPDGKLRSEWEGHNLLMAQWFTSAANTNVTSNTDPILKVSAGSDTTATTRDSGATTITATGTQESCTVTASSGFFLASDVGKLINTDGNIQLKITGFTSSTVVTCSTNGVVASVTGQFTVYYIDQTSMTELAQLTKLTLANQTPWTRTYGAVTSTCQRVVFAQSASLSAGGTINELGVWNTANQLTGRVVITPTVYNIGDVVKLTITQTISVDSATKAVSAGSLSGTLRFHAFSANGGSDTAYFHQYTFGSYIGNNGLSGFAKATSVTGLPTPVFSIISGTYIKANTNTPVASVVSTDLVWTNTIQFNTATANIAIYAFAFQYNNQTPASSPSIYNYDLTAPYTKTSSQNLNIVFTETYSRVLVN